jgi:hypothetical protein
MICAWTSYSDIIWRKISESGRSKKYIFEKTLMVPAIYENGTLFATNQKLTLEMLKEISDSEDVSDVERETEDKIRICIILEARMHCIAQ